jgi:hypothetical protein
MLKIISVKKRLAKYIYWRATRQTVCILISDFVSTRICHAAIWWTFTSNPEILAQLYTLHIKVGDEFFPQLWCLLPDKQAATYTRLFQLMVQEATAAQLQLRQTTIHIDFEMDVMQSVRAVFGIQPSGYLLHFTQSILRHVQQCGLQTSYNDCNPPAVREWIRREIGPLIFLKAITVPSMGTSDSDTQARSLLRNF